MIKKNITTCDAIRCAPQISTTPNLRVYTKDIGWVRLCMWLSMWHAYLRCLCTSGAHPSAISFILFQRAWSYTERERVFNNTSTRKTIFYCHNCPFVIRRHSNSNYSLDSEVTDRRSTWCNESYVVQLTWQRMVCLFRKHKTKVPTDDDSWQASNKVWAPICTTGMRWRLIPNYQPRTHTWKRKT